MPDARGNKISCSNYQCEIELTVEILSGKWKALLIWNLHQKGIIRYNEFRKQIPSITQKNVNTAVKRIGEVWNYFQKNLSYCTANGGIFTDKNR